MKKRILLVAVFTFLVGVTSVRAIRRPAPERPQEKPEWRQLFNGRNLDGWTHVGPGRFLVEDGLLRTEGHMGLLWYTGEKFGTCELKVVYKVGKADSNSGVFIRIAQPPTDPWIGVHHGFEVQICDQEDEYHTTGVIYSITKALARPEKAPGEWNTMLIKMKGTHVAVELNGVLVTDFDSTAPMPPRKQWYEPDRKPIRPEAGYIGLQNHDDKDSHVYFKEVSVRPLSGE